MKKFVCCLVLALVSCTQAPVNQGPGSLPKPAEIPAKPEIPTAKGYELPNFNQKWADFTVKAVKAQLANLNKGKEDMKRFCPKYNELNIDQQAIAWGYLISAMIKFESDYNVNSDYNESDGNVSRGLLQLSYGDQFCPKSKAEGDLHDPYINLACGIKIMGSYVARDSVIAAGGYVKYGAPAPKGLARYWAVLRVPDSKSKHELAEIIARSRKAPGCL